MDIPWCMLGWAELTQSDMLLGSTAAVIPEDTTALPNMSRLISCSIYNRAEYTYRLAVTPLERSSKEGTMYKLTVYCMTCRLTRIDNTKTQELIKSGMTVTYHIFLFFTPPTHT